MVLSLVKGQKMDITKNNPAIQFLHIGLEWETINRLDIDPSAFMLGTDGKIVREEDFVFYGQPISSNGSVRLEESISSIEKQHFLINLSEVPEEVDKISFTLTIYESDTHDLTFSDVSNIQLRIVNSKSQEEIAAFSISYSFTKESAIVLGALYRYSGEWKFHAVGAGFYGGLADLCQEYGVEVEEQAAMESQIEVPSNLISASPVQRFQVVQTREETQGGELIPEPPVDSIQLKRSSFVQFNESRIQSLSQQSDELINLFYNEAEEKVPAFQQREFQVSPTIPTLMGPTAESDDEAFIDALDDDEMVFLAIFEHGRILNKQANAFLKQKGRMLALFVNTINEKANVHLGDNLLQILSDSIVIYEEFKSLVLLIKERVQNEH